MSISYCEEYVSFKGELSDNDIKELVSAGKFKRIQTDSATLDKATFKKLNDKYFVSFPEVELRIYTSGDCDIDGISLMDKLRKLSVESSASIVNIEEIYSLENLKSINLEAKSIADKDFLNKLPRGIESLGLKLASKSFDLKGITRFSELKILSLHNCSKNIECVTGLNKLERLKLHGISLESCAFINEIKSLRMLGLSGGNTENLSELYGNDRISELYLFKQTKLNNLDILAKLTELKVAEVSQMARVKELPDLSKSKLEHLFLENMKGLVNLDGVEHAPCLKTITETVCPSHRLLEQLLPVMRNEVIERCAFFTSSSKKNREFEELIEQSGKLCEHNFQEVRALLFPMEECRKSLVILVIF